MLVDLSTRGERRTDRASDRLKYLLAQWLSWLERRPVTAEVVSSSLIWVVKLDCAYFFRHACMYENAGIRQQDP